MRVFLHCAHYAHQKNSQPQQGPATAFVSCAPMTARPPQEAGWRRWVHLSGRQSDEATKALGHVGTIWSATKGAQTKWKHPPKSNEAEKCWAEKWGLKPKNIWTQVVNQSQLMLVKGESKSLKKSKHLTLAFAEKKSIAQILVPETFTVSVVGSACFAGVNLLLIGAKIGLRIIFWVLRLVCQPHDFCVTKPWFGECLCSRGNMLTFPPTMPRNLPRIQVTSQVAKPHYPASWEDAVSFQIISKVNTETPQMSRILSSVWKWHIPR